MLVRTLVPITLVIALAGCGSVGAIGLPWNRDKQVAQQQPQPLPATTLAPVQSADLPPPGGYDPNNPAYDPNNPNAMASGGLPADGTDMMSQPLAPPNGTQVAAAPASGGAIGRTDLLGGWTITSGSDSCQLFMTLTSWTGGYRASTRGCQSETLKSVSAWNLQGSEVILAGQGGQPLARLASSGTNRFDGSANGQGIAFYR